MPFIHAIRYQPAREATSSDGSGEAAGERIGISFHCEDALQRLDLIVARIASSPPSFACARVDCSRVTSVGPLRIQLQQQLCPSSGSSLSAASAAGATLPGLFSAVESVIRILRAHSQLESASVGAVTPQTHQRVAHQLVTEIREQQFNEAKILPRILAQDVYLSLLSAAAHSARSCALVHPFPPCCLAPSSRCVSASRVSAQELDAGVLQLQAALALMPPLLPLYAHVAHAPDANSAAQVLHASLPLAALELLSFVNNRTEHLGLRGIDLSSLSSLTPAAASPSIRNWYRFENETGENRSCPSPHWQLDLDVHDPYFDELAASEATRGGGGGGKVLTVFHGSPLANWHSIVQQGIQVKSGSKEQTSGALFGGGVYLTDDLRVARNFAKAALSGWKHSALAERIECVGVYELIIPKATTTAAAPTSIGDSSTPPPVRRAPPSELHRHGGAVDDDAVPDNYFVVSDVRYLRLRHLLLWRADGLQPQPVRLPLLRLPAPSSVLFSATGSSVASTKGSLPQLRPELMLHGASAPPPLPPLRQRCLALARSAFSEYGMLLAYALLLLAIVVAQMDWTRTRKIVLHWWKMQQSKRF